MEVCLQVLSEGKEEAEGPDYLRSEEPFGDLELSSAVYGSLKLSIKGLKTLPEEVFEYTNLTKLDLTHNNLTNFPPVCDVLVNLEEVLLDDNILSSLPTDLSSLSKLSTLSLNYNRFNHIPSVLSSVSSLRQLHLNWNWIEGFEDDCSLFQLKELKTLSLCSNKISVLPPDFCLLSSLVVLNLRRNQIRVIPKQLEKLERLSELYVAENPIDTILADFSNFRQLSTLSLWSCLFSSFPPSNSDQDFSVTRLDMSDCNLDYFGGSWPACAHLDVSDNQLSTLETIQNPRQLAQLLASNNNIQSFPSWMLSSSEPSSSPTPSLIISPSLSPLSLAPLVKVDLSNNSLEEIPKGLGGLLKLRSLDLSRNLIKNCDGLEELLCLPDLRILQLASNQISCLPPHPSPAPPGRLYKTPPKTQAPHLHFLNFHDNFLQDIPLSFFQFFPLFANKHARSPGTRTIILSYNQFSKIPEELGNIQGLECLHFAGNDIDSDSLELFLPKWPLLRVLSLADVRIHDPRSPSTPPPTPPTSPCSSPLFDKREKKPPASPSNSPLLSSSPKLSLPEGIHKSCSNLHRLHLRNTPLSSLPNSLFQMSRSLYEVDLSPIPALSLPATEDPRLALPLSIPPASEDYTQSSFQKLSASLPPSSPTIPSTSPFFGAIGEVGGGLGGAGKSLPVRKNRTRAISGGKKVRVTVNSPCASPPFSSTLSPNFLMTPPSSPLLYPASPLSSPFSSPTISPSHSPSLFNDGGAGGVLLSGEQTIRKWNGGDVGCAKIIGVEGKNEDRLLVRFGNGVELLEEKNKKTTKGEEKKKGEKEEGEYDWGYFGVFDGHGGKEGSTFVCSHFHKILFAELAESSKNPDEWTEEIIIDSFNKSFQKVTEKMHAHFLSRHIKTMQGTTATVGVVIKDKLYVANVGDSRGTLCWGGEAIRISRDHKPGDRDEMERVRKMRGLMKPFTKNSKRYRIFQVAARSGGRSVALSRTLGDFHVHPFVVSHPHIVSLSLPFLSSPLTPSHPPPPTPEKSSPPPPPLKSSSSFFSSFNWGLGLGYSSSMPSGSSLSLPKTMSFSPSDPSEDCFLVLASDGLWDVCTDSDVAQIIRFSEDATQGAIRLRDHAVHLGSMDDTAVLVVRFGGLPKKHLNGFAEDEV